MRIAYMMSRFPKITETFVLREMLEMEALGADVDVYPLQRETTAVAHPEAAAYVERAHFKPLLSAEIAAAQARMLLRGPAKYIATWTKLLSANWGSTRYLGGAMAFFPKAVAWAELMQRRGVDHIHAHFASHPAAMAYTIHKLTGISFSFTAHGSDLHRDQHMLKEKVEAASAVITVSEYNRRMILDICGDTHSDRVHVIHCGVDVDDFTPRRRSISGTFRLLCVGTLHEVKGQQYLIEACRLLKEQGLSVTCGFVGDGPDEASLRTLVQQNDLADSVVFHGRKTSSEVRDLMIAADALVAPSVPTQCGRREGIPVVLMEAMASGLPVIASDLSGIPEIIDDGLTGLLTPVRDSQAIAESIERLVGDVELRRDLAIAGRLKVERDFNLRTNTAALLEVIRESGGHR